MLKDIYLNGTVINFGERKGHLARRNCQNKQLKIYCRNKCNCNTTISARGRFGVLFTQNQYRKLYEHFQEYFRIQLSKRFVKDEIAIPVSDDIFYFACMILILQGDYEKAEQIIICNKSIVRNRHIYKQIEHAIEITRNL